jgi:hypothetical protein
MTSSKFEQTRPCSPKRLRTALGLAACLARPRAVTTAAAHFSDWFRTVVASQQPAEAGEDWGEW